MNEVNLAWVHPRMEELSALLALPDTMRDRLRWMALMQEYDRLKPIDALLQKLESLRLECTEAQNLLADPEMQLVAREETSRLLKKIAEARLELRHLLDRGRETESDKVIVEIRAGAGGEEAALFAAMLLRMYLRYAERRGWRTEMLSVTDTEMGGVKEAIFSVRGREVLKRLRNESGVHRIQRIPVTESNGKRQTSTATVAVLPEAIEVDLNVDPDDLRIDVYRASGHGGQYINKTDSAVRITHLPTGIVATCQDEKSQLRNKEKAMEVLRARLLDRMQREKDATYAEDRKSQVGSGDRSERIRTYNFNDGRVTDHRIGRTIYNLDAFVDGDMDPIVNPLIRRDETAELEAGRGAMNGRNGQ